MPSRDVPYPDAPVSNTFADGEEFADLVAELLHRKCGLSIYVYRSQRKQFTVGESPQGVEIKLDRTSEKSGCLSIEVAEKSRNSTALSWTPSGILRADNTALYAVGHHKIVFVLPRVWLRLVYQINAATPGFIVQPNPTIRNFYLPMPVAMKLAVWVLRRDGEEWLVDPRPMPDVQQAAPVLPREALRGGSLVNWATNWKPTPLDLANAQGWGLLDVPSATADAATDDGLPF